MFVECLHLIVWYSTQRSSVGGRMDCVLTMTFNGGWRNIGIKSFAIQSQIQDQALSATKTNLLKIICLGIKFCSLGFTLCVYTLMLKLHTYTFRFIVFKY